MRKYFINSIPVTERKFNYRLERAIINYCQEALEELGLSTDDMDLDDEISRVLYEGHWFLDRNDEFTVDGVVFTIERY